MTIKHFADFICNFQNTVLNRNVLRQTFLFCLSSNLPCMGHIQGVPRNMTVAEYLNLSCLISKKIKINNKSKFDPRLRYAGVKDVSTELNCQKSLNRIQYLEADILNYTSTIMFRGTPCKLPQKMWASRVQVSWRSLDTNKQANQKRQTTM